MSFDAWFRASSYATVVCGAGVMAVAGGVGWVPGLLFAAALALAWSLEGGGRQLKERAGLFVVLASLPVFYLDWRLQESAAQAGAEAAASLAALVHFTLFISAVKLLQVKSDRDWLFLYLISFFEVLLGAGMGASPVFLAALAVYLFCALLAVVCFELRKSLRGAPHSGSSSGRVTFGERPGRRARRWAGADARAQGSRRLPLAALSLLVLVFALALPIFYVTPRFGSRPGSMGGGGGEPAQVGFSDTVTLGDFGRIQKNDRLVMRVRVEGERATRGGSLRWRGVPLDHFDGHSWRRTSNESEIMMGGDRDFFQLGTTEHLNRLTTQTFFVEPLDTPILFAAPRAIALQGALDYVRRYADGGALTTRPHPKERISYRVYSDTVEPAPADLRADARRYPRERTPNLQADIGNYLQLPAELDPGVAALAALVVEEAGARTRYDAARAVEAHLNSNAYGGRYGYSLERRGEGDDPIADFLFNVREGHCEYFATAMAVMLRTHGVAARVVNGFQAGEYNASADAYLVRQYDAHSWVEVYFPETDSWVTFDPTPAAGRPGAGAEAGFAARMRRYAEALELFWIQYVVAYDRQEQRSLANSIRGQLGTFRRSLAQAAEGLGAGLSAWLGGGSKGEGGRSWAAFLRLAFGLAAACVVLLVIIRGGLKLYAGRRRRAAGGGQTSAVEFYRRMTAALEARGLRREADQTPLEFATSVGTPEVLAVTRAYHGVRYGARSLTADEAREVERCLRLIEEAGADERAAPAE